MKTIIDYARAIIYVLVIAICMTLGAITATAFYSNGDWFFAFLSCLFFSLAVAMQLGE